MLSVLNVRWMVQINTLSKEEVEEYRKKYIKEDKEKKSEKGEKDKNGNRVSLEQPTNSTVAETTAQPADSTATNTASSTATPINTSGTVTPNELSDSKKQLVVIHNGTSDDMHVLGETPKSVTNDNATTGLSDSSSGKTAEKDGEKEKQFNWVMNNYFSIGMHFD